MGTKSDNPRQSQDEVSGILENGWACSGEKDAYKNKWNVIKCHVNVRSDFYATDNFPGTFVDILFHDVYQGLDERISTYVDPFQ